MENSNKDYLFRVQIIGKHIVKATDIHPLQPRLIRLSNLDLLCGRFPVTYLYLYPSHPYSTSTTIIESLKASLGSTLNHYYPFVGRIATNPKTNEPEIICNNHGALLVEAHANIPLPSIDFYNLNLSLQGKLVATDDDFPLQVQVTQFTCRGVSVTFTFDHALGDASALGHFLRSWSQIAQGKSISISRVPIVQRDNVFLPRSPPTYHASLDDTYVSCDMKDILENIPSNDISIKRLYHIDAIHINRLQEVASKEGFKRSKIEAFSAYIWKLMANSTKTSSICTMGWLVDGRRRTNKSLSMSNYIGNVLSVATGEANIEDLKEGSLFDVGEIVHSSILKATNESHFLDLVDWIECHRPGLMLAKVVLGKGKGKGKVQSPCLVLSSAGRFPVAELDFGFGSPVLGTVCSTINRIGTGYMNQRPSAKGDGSWVVAAIIWPGLAEALESDPDHVFQPITPTHLGF
ncbi:hypothetical protein ACHQM5_028257 [Ranunculus cassubicifolius]